MRSSSGARDVQGVGGGDEHHLGEVEVHLEVVIVEGRGSAPGRAPPAAPRPGRPGSPCAILSISSSRNSGLRDAGLGHVLDDLARQRADIGAAVAADLGLVAHAAERHAHELAVGGARDGLAERGLADARAGRPGRGSGP